MYMASVYSTTYFG